MEPMKLTNWFVDKPCTVLCVCFAILLFITGITFKQNWIFLSDTHDRDFLIWSDPLVERSDMKTLAFDYLEKYDGKRPKALDFFLKMVNISEDEFYDHVFNHIVYPHKELDRNILKNNQLNKSPSDFIEIEKMINK